MEINRERLGIQRGNFKMESLQSKATRIFQRCFGLSIRQKLKIADHAMMILSEISCSSEFAIDKAARVFGVELSREDRDWIYYEIKPPR